MLHLYLNSTCILFNTLLTSCSTRTVREFARIEKSQFQGMRVSCIPESAITLYRESLCAFQNLPLEKLATVFAYEMYRRLVSPRTRQKKLLFFLEISLPLSLSFSASCSALCENEGIKACSPLTMPSSHDQVNGSWREIFYPLLYTRFAEISVFQFFFFSPLFLFLYCVPRLSINAIVSIL